jgi:L-threonylcarbamoyladenylate synthase
MSAEAQTIQFAADRLRAGGLVAFPTETVYGLGADAFSEAAVRKVFELKGRPGNNPLIVHVEDEAMARRVVAQWPRRAAELARAFWPGPLSIILPKRAELPDMVTGGRRAEGTGVAVRCPDHPVALALLRAFGGPLVGPSANPSGRVSPTTAAHVREAFKEDEVMVLDGGACRAGIESTVVSLMQERARVLRPGVIGAERIAAVLDEPVDAARAEQATIGPLASPGLLASHYAPAAPTIIFDDADWPSVLAGSTGVVVVLTHRSRAVAAPHIRIGMPGDASGYAAGLYAALREADALGPARIVVERPPMTGGDEASTATWRAVADRLSRAARPFREL